MDSSCRVTYKYLSGSLREILRVCRKFFRYRKLHLDVLNNTFFFFSEMGSPDDEVEFIVREI